MPVCIARRRGAMEIVDKAMKRNENHMRVGTWYLRAMPVSINNSSGDAARRPNGPAAVARGSRRDARPEPAATPDCRCTTCGCSAPAGEPRGR